MDKANNGIKIATQENNSALARVVCAVKAGSRYEDSSQRGVSHCLRVATDLTQKETRAFYLVKALQQMGGNITYVLGPHIRTTRKSDNFMKSDELFILRNSGSKELIDNNDIIYSLCLVSSMGPALQIIKTVEIKHFVISFSDAPLPENT